MNRARKALNLVVGRRHESPPPTEQEFNLAVTHAQEARERISRIQEGHCYCPEEKTGK